MSAAPQPSLPPRRSLPSLFPAQPPPPARIGLWWVPLYLTVLLAGTLTPLTFGIVPQDAWPTLSLPDGLFNVIAFLPLGWALRRRGLILVVLVACGLSGSVEYLQRWLGRTPSTWDVLANTLGAVWGYGFLRIRGSQRYLEQLLRGAGPALLALAMLVVTFVAMRAPLLNTGGLGGWSPYPLVLGEVHRGSPPWEGTLHSLALYDRVLDPAEAALAADPPDVAGGGPILWLDFREAPVLFTQGPEGRQRYPLGLPQRAGYAQERGGLRFGLGGFVLPEAAALHVRERLLHRDRLSLALELTPPRLPSLGPRSLFSMARASGRANLSVTQRGRQLVVGVRSRIAGDGLRGPGLTLTGTGRQRVVATFGDHWSRVFVDGKLGGALYLPSLHRAWFLGQGVVLTLVVCVALFGLAAFLLLGKGGAVGRAGLIAGGLAALVLLYFGGASQHHELSFLRMGLPVLVTLLSLLPWARLYDAPGP